VGDGVYVDVTFGGGGHSREILSRLGSEGRLYAFDQDEDVLKNVIDDKRFIFVRSNFRYIKNFMKLYGEEKVDGIFADLGVSSHHFDESDRGFSFRFDGPLDMRMNRSARTTAADLLNTYTDKQLADVFYLYGEIRNSRRLAEAVVKSRATKPFVTIGDFLDVLKPLVKPEKEKKEITKAFQALRIEVNHEMDALRKLLLASVELLKPGGRLVVITYHSLEDRMVKNVMKTGNVEGVVNKDFYGNIVSPFHLINNKVETPDKDELESNPRSRSAKLRVAEKI
jgi:16S rRNA (cytosine1402-N4)-methyltransferase